MTASEQRTNPVAGLLKLLDLSEAEGARTDEEIFVGISEPQPHGRVFGGQVLAQSILAAVRTVSSDREIHSMHGYFLRPGDANEPITFGVQRLRDGRSFSARRTHAYQNGVPILSMIASFQAPAPGLDHQEPFPEGIPDPESLPSTADLLGEFDHPIAQQWAFQRPFDIRHVQSPLYITAEGEHTPTNSVWMKAKGPLPDNPDLHRAALAYASDYTLLEPILRAHGIAWISPGMKFASLDHAMWWHRPFRADEWLLYVQNSPSASGARGLGVGRVFSRSGELVATIAQEGMMRVPIDTIDPADA